MAERYNEDVKKLVDLSAGKSFVIAPETTLGVGLYRV